MALAPDAEATRTPSHHIQSAKTPALSPASKSYPVGPTCSDPFQKPHLTTRREPISSKRIRNAYSPRRRRMGRRRRLLVGGSIGGSAGGRMGGRMERRIRRGVEVDRLPYFCSCRGEPQPSSSRGVRLY